MDHREGLFVSVPGNLLRYSARCRASHMENCGSADDCGLEFLPVLLLRLLRAGEVRRSDLQILGTNFDGSLRFSREKAEAAHAARQGDLNTEVTEEDHRVHGGLGGADGISV